MAPNLPLPRDPSMTRRVFAAAIVAACFLAGCAGRGRPFAFLGIPETESSGKGPVGLIAGKPCRVNNVTPVSEVPYEDYQAAGRNGRIFAEQRHGGYVYYAVKEQRDVPFDNASAWLEVIERFKAKLP